MSPLQARYILQYIQTFTIDTLTIWQLRRDSARRRTLNGEISDLIDLTFASDN